jgi:hypothetical protein
MMPKGDKAMNIYNRATRVVASTLGVLVGLAGIDHGIFEIFQGHVLPDAMMIAAIGPEQRFWIYGEETALTIVPSFLISGILAVIFGVLVTLWAVGFIDRKHGAGIFMLLSIVLFLVGGGFAPIFMAVIASLTATRINKPLKSWRKVLPGGVRAFLGKIWLVVLVAFVLIFVFSVVAAIFGWPLTVFFDDETAFEHLNSISFVMVGMLLLSSLTGFAHDIQEQIEKESSSYE